MEANNGSSYEGEEWFSWWQYNDPSATSEFLDMGNFTDMREVLDEQHEQMPHPTEDRETYRGLGAVREADTVDMSHGLQMQEDNNHVDWEWQVEPLHGDPSAGTESNVQTHHDHGPDDIHRPLDPNTDFNPSYEYLSKESIPVTEVGREMRTIPTDKTSASFDLEDDMFDLDFTEMRNIETSKFNLSENNSRPPSRPSELTRQLVTQMDDSSVPSMCLSVF